MNPEDKIRSAFSDLGRRSRQDVDAQAHLARVEGRRRTRGLVPALVSAGAVGLAIGGFALLGLFSGDVTPDDDIVSPPSTTATTATSVPEQGTQPGLFGPGMPGLPFVLSETPEGNRAGLLGQRELLSGFTEIRAAFSDGQGGVVYLSGSTLFWQTGQGDTRQLSDGVDALAGVYSTAGSSSAAYVTSSDQGSDLVVSALTPDPAQRTDARYSLDWVEGKVLDIDVDASNLALIAERDGCRWVLIARDFAAAGSPPVGSIDRGTCMAQQDGWPRAVAISGERVVVAESASAGEIEFTHDEVATYDLGAIEIARHRVDTFLDIDILDLDLDQTKALIAGEFLWVLDVETGQRIEVSDPIRSGQAIVGASWTTVLWNLPASLDPRTIAFRVKDVAAGDVLNVRTEPDPSASITAQLAPNYAAIGDTGETAIASGGGKWRLVTMLDPVRLEGLGEPLHGGAPIGWVNEAFLEPLTERMPVGSEDVSPCQGPSTDASQGSGQAPDHVYSVWMSQIGDCLRLVVTLGTDFDPSFPGYDAISTDPRPITGIPAFELSTTDREVTVNFPGLTQVWQFGVDRNRAFVVRETDGSLSVAVLTATDAVVVTPLPGRIVVDMRGAAPQPSVNLVAASPTEAVDGEIIVTGVARPFEATLGIELRDTSGNPVTATFEGSSFLGTVTDSRYAVMTTDYIEAWGRFAFKVTGLAPGRYELFMSSDAMDEPSGFSLVFDVG